MLYKNLVRPILFSADPESVHDFVMKAARIARNPVVAGSISRLTQVSDVRLSQKLFGLKFDNPIGLAAGFDKDAQAFEFFDALGFGFVEIGTVTGEAQPGNPRPRIFRLKRDEALINRMGFPSKGADAVAAELKLRRRTNMAGVLGINIGKTKSIELDQAHADYLASFSKLQALGDYFVLNVSSPNTPELRKLQEPERLKQLIGSVQEINSESKPLLVKIAPDLSFTEIDQVLEVCDAAKVSGLIATNTTNKRENLLTEIDQAGGLSGKPLRARSLEVISYISKQTGGRLPLIGVGGISSINDVVATLKAGANLVQIYTALIYEGPLLVKKLQKELSRYLDQNSISSLSELVKSA